MSQGFVGDDDLHYRSQRLRFEPGRPLVLDEAYRANQLPLLDPTHPKAINRLPGSDAVLGRYEQSRVSAVVMLSADELEASPAYRDLVAALRDSPVGAKIDWAMADKRRSMLHATLWSRLERTMDLSDARRRIAALAGIGPMAVAVGGFWLGAAFNRGRIYLPLYPERRDGADAFVLLQRRLGGRETGLYAMGLFNLTDDLTEGETAALGRLVESADGRIVAETTIRELTLLATNDDLALSGRILDAVAL